MSASAELVEEAAFTLSHAGQILRLASLQSRDETFARDLWHRAAEIEELAGSVKNLAASREAPP